MKLNWFLASLILSSSVPSFALSAGALDISAGESNRITGSDIQLTSDFKIKAQAASFHAPEEATFKIQNADNCDFRQLSENEIQLGQHCDFLTGTFSYLFRPDGGITRHQITVGFSVSRPRSESRIFMVSPPLETVESKR